MKLTLNSWAAKNFELPPKIATLRCWANNGLIVPNPIKVGRNWMVDEDAEYRPERKIMIKDDVLRRIING